MNQLDKFKLTKYDYNKHLSIELVVTNFCNQQCDYCHWNSSRVRIQNKYMSLEEFDKVLDFIETQDRETIEFSFYGGEPTLNPNLPEMIEHLYSRFVDNLVKVTLLTNLTADFDFWDSIELYPIDIIASLHSDQTGFYDFPVNLTYVSCKHNIELIRVVLSESNCKRAIGSYNIIKRTYPDKVILHKIDQLSMERAKEIIGDQLDDIDMFDCTDTAAHVNDDEVEIIIDGKYVPLKDCQDCHNFKGMLCSAGFVIQSNGDVLKCWKDLGKRVLLNIFNNDIKKLTVWEMCRYDLCHCDERFTKLNIKEYMKNEFRTIK